MRRTRASNRSTAPLPQFIMSWGFLIIAVVLLCNSQVHGEEKAGRCPAPGMDSRLCGNQEDQCKDDAECSGESKCCQTGCSKVCILPQFTACESARLWTERRARSLEPADAASVNIPKCNDTGSFEEIQCDKDTGRCWCVNSQGFEKPGTRARSLEFVNCSSPSRCGNHQCRMLCPLDFDLDEGGCPVCQCRDPCKGVKCPNSLECELEEVPCTNEPCPPLPTCKQARTLESLCPIGVPLILPESGNPYLCGTDTGKPTCPPAFECSVKAGNDYGVCCASNSLMEKPGSCPVVTSVASPSSTDDESEMDAEAKCGLSCRLDIECPQMNKCCMTEKCGKRCAEPANSTLCLQQMKMAEILSVKEIEGKGYIPQCDEYGDFVTRQCSRNGKVCWCVDAHGRNLQQSLGPADSVNCSNIHKQRAVQTSSSLDSCDTTICLSTCEFGFKFDRNGCRTCDCVENPCHNYECPAGSKCSLIQNPSCDGPSCLLKPTCLSETLYVNPCDVGTPLTDIGSGQVVTCSETSTTCPSSHICVVVSLNKAGLCCVNRPRVEPTKAGMCPFLSPSLCNGTMGLESKQCTSDKGCEGDMKCCAVGGCGAVCADPLLNDATENKLPTMCQYLKGIKDHVGGSLENFKLAIHSPSCKDNGEFEEVQCAMDSCWCVDEFGAEIPATKVEKAMTNLTSTSCMDKRRSPGCLGMNCRLGCDYGFETLDGCRICECRNPCKDSNLCDKDQQCEMVDVDCWEGHCPSLPYCVPKSLTKGKCPKGDAFLEPTTNETLTCNPRARMLQCPDDYFCHDLESSHDFGLCCPVLYDTEFDQTSVDVAENRQSSVDSNALLVETEEQNGNRRRKLGQCPYLVPLSSGTCDYECNQDGDCEDDKKCCSNGCGTQCNQPVVLTACQHQKSIMEHKARESGIPAQRVFLPQCRNDNGGYEAVQCHPVSRICWCVNDAGEEMAGTRGQPGQRPNCRVPNVCPERNCHVNCPLGYKLDDAGCPSCFCKDPCEDTICNGGNEECRLMQVSCLSEPCPPVPVCLPRLDNPCSIGEPLNNPVTGERVVCGPSGSSCPSSHKCSLSPFGDYAVCCPKSKEVCFEKKDVGHCKAAITKWFFNTESNACEEFHHSGCGGNLNMFDSKAECLSICPSLTSCERSREKSLELLAKYKHLNYIPKCDPGNGDWEPVQCIEQVGMCWCVNKKGESVKGSMTTGKPNCNFRQSRGRHFGAVSLQDAPVCKEGVTVHVCNKTLCDNKFCLAHPHASCRVDPCGGCRIVFYDENNEAVNCEAGLGKCHRDLQKVINSPASSNLMSIVIKDFPGTSDGDSLTSSAISDNELSELLRTVISSVEQKVVGGGGVGIGNTMTRTQVKPIYADLNGEKIVGVAASSLTVVGGHGHAQQGSGEGHRPGHIDSIADILDGIMNMRSLGRAANSNEDTSLPEVEEGEEENLSDFMDLMPSSSQLYGIESMPHHPFGSAMPVAPGVHFELIVPQAVIQSRGQLSRGRALRESLEEDEEEALSSNSGISFSIVRPEKAGRCPPPKSFALLHILSGACHDTCLNDNQCGENLKCCMGDCGFKCLEPVGDITPPVATTPEPALVAKPGECPKPEELNLSCFGNSGNNYRCHADTDCPQTEKCCFDGCSTTCLAPKAEDGEPIIMVATAPQCQENGEYETQQSQGELMWCVDPDGNPLPHTFTRGRVSCTKNGSIVERHLRGKLCPSSEQEPMICIDQCLTASCPAHPTAMCVADPCNECKVTFYKQSGEKVGCEDKCTQPSEAGLCRASFTKFFHNISSGRCEEFIYGGCQGNDNNFETMKDCESECRKPVDVCNLPMKPGLCRASVERWYFNPESQSCEQFIYGGCGGNDNNFGTKEQCETRCPDVVLCPHIIEGQLNACSRASACQNVTCGSLDPEEYMCKVDPCSCTANVKDLLGNDLDCSTIAIPSSVPTTPSTTTTTTTEPIPSEEMSSEFMPDFEKAEVHLNKQPDFEDQMLRVNMDVSSMKSRCVMVSKIHFAQCDELGQFQPIQCSQESKSAPLCWCVDEAGNQIEGTKPFLKGSQNCKRVQVDKVDVVLNFPVSDDTSSVQMGVEMQDLLQKYHASLHENRVEVEVLPGSTNLRFSLLGNNKVDVSYLLEEMVKLNAIGVTEDKEFIPADLSLSRFHHVVSQSYKIDESDINENSIVPDDGVVSSEVLGLDNEYNTIFILLTVVAAITAVLFVIGFFLAFQKKKTTGSYPKKPFDSLAFSSQLYEIEKKMPLEYPTFKVTPYVQEFQSTDEKHPDKDDHIRA